MNKADLLKFHFNWWVIAAFISVVFIPAGVLVMFLCTDWKKKTKIVLTSVLMPVWIILLVFVLLAIPASNSDGVVLPVESSVGSTEFQSSTKVISDKEKETDYFDVNDGKKIDEPVENQDASLPKSLKRSKSYKPGRVFFSILFLILMLILVIIRNLKAKKNTGEENPYVDTNQYKFPLKKMENWPIVHFQNISHRTGEKFLFASKAKYNMEEGDILITSQRFVFKGLNEKVEFELPELDAAASVSNTCFVLTRNDKKFYFFVSENQMKYALNILRFACGLDV